MSSCSTLTSETIFSDTSQYYSVSLLPVLAANNTQKPVSKSFSTGDADVELDSVIEKPESPKAVEN